jgi:addiction module HigA family antidote
MADRFSVDHFKPMRLTPYAVAQACGVPRTRIERLTREATPVTADTALRLARYFGTTVSFWMGMQTQYDLERAQDEITCELQRIAPVKQAGSLADCPELSRVENFGRTGSRRFFGDGNLQ